MVKARRLFDWHMANLVRRRQGGSEGLERGQRRGLGTPQGLSKPCPYPTVLRCVLAAGVCQQLHPGVAVAAALGPGRPQRAHGGALLPARCVARWGGGGGGGGARLPSSFRRLPPPPPVAARQQAPLGGVCLHARQFGPKRLCMLRCSNRSPGPAHVAFYLQAATAAGCSCCAEGWTSSTAARCGKYDTAPQVGRRAEALEAGRQPWLLT